MIQGKLVAACNKVHMALLPQAMRHATIPKNKKEKPWAGFRTKPH